jgi:hypothetical protein
MKYRLCLILLLITLIPRSPSAQVYYQRIKGYVVDADSRESLPGANIVILDTDPLLGTISDTTGYFRIEKVPVGRHEIQVSYIGYSPLVLPEILVGSGKEVELDIRLQQTAGSIDEVNIVHRKEKPVNSMATLSARSFTVEEARRFAGGLDDPARLVSAFAGVTTTHFGDNAIIVRGNSPKGVLWKLEGVEIPNPNHFAGANVAGGGFVTLFSSQLLAKSDFYTGAFPAEYGNSLAAVFDMRLRNGNRDKREYTFQLGTMGIDISSEGPFQMGGRATYLFNYRYSTAGILSDLGILPIGEQRSKYQDLSFKLNFPTKTAGVLSIWGIGGMDLSQKPEKRDSTEWEVVFDRINQDWYLNTGAVGISHRYILGSNTYMHSTIALNGVSNTMDYKIIDTSLVLKPNWLIKDNSARLTAAVLLNHKFTASLTLRTGANYHALFFNYDMSGTINDAPSTFQNFVQENGSSDFIEYYFQFRYKSGRRLSVLPGIHFNYFALNKDYSIDPRLSAKWDFHPDHSLSIGYGKHSQREDLKFYLIQKIENGETVYPNRNLKLSRAHHLVFAWDWSISQNMMLKVEPYYQHLFDIPGVPNSSCSMINFKQDWSFRDSLENNSIGINRGVDITLERLLSRNYYFLVSASLFDSKYRADDQVRRNTRYNMRYVVNFLVGREFFIRRKNILGINARFNFTGGERVSPILMQASLRDRTVYYDDSRAFEDQYPPTSYLDLTLTYRINRSRYASMFALQVKNALAEPWRFGYSYNFRTGGIENNAEVVVLPVLSYKIEF